MNYQDTSLLPAFKKIVFVQILAFSNILLSKDMLMLVGLGEESAQRITDILFLSITALYIKALYKMIKIFTKNPLVLNSVIISFTLAFLVGAVIENPFIDWHFAGKDYYFLAIHLCFSFGTILIIYFTVLEIFEEQMSVKERLWGSASVYFLIAWVFGGFYDIIAIFSPNALGFLHQHNLASYMKSIAYSLSVLGNFNPLYENVNLLISHIAIVEAVWAHLFVVLVVGRLLAK